MIKKLIFLISAILYLNANHISWFGDYDKALEKAKEENKPLMILLIKDDCKKCKDIVKRIFTNHPYLDKLNKKVIPVIVNNSSKQSYPREMYWSNTYPTLFFVDSKTETFIHKPFYHDVSILQIEGVLK